MKDKAWLSWELSDLHNSRSDGEANPPVMWSHPDSPEPVKRGQKYVIKTHDHEKSQTWKTETLVYRNTQLYHKWCVTHVYWDTQFQAVFRKVMSHHVISVHCRFFNYPHTAPQPQAINGPSLLSAASQFIPHHSHTLPPLLGLPAPAPPQHCIQAAQPTPSNLVTHHHGYQHPANIVLGMRAPSCSKVTSNSCPVTCVQGNSNGWTIWELTSAMQSWLEHLAIWWVISDTLNETSASIFRAQDKMGTEVSSKKVLKFHCLWLIGTKVTNIRTHFEYKITSKTQKAGQSVYS